MTNKSHQSIQPEIAFSALATQSHNSLAPTTAFIDVRSEGEFSFAHFSGTQNIPILNNQERHEVGTRFKEQGQEAAIALANELVAPHRENRIQQMLAATQTSPQKIAWVMCWRGGLRSKTACDWIKVAGADAIQIVGGYKALRSIAMQTLDQPPDAWIISGKTGTQKTKLLNLVKSDGLPACDLEHHARHKGSAFGKLLNQVVPSQTHFENCVALDLYQQKWIILEDESKRIGDLFVPKKVYTKIDTCPVIIIRATVEERCAGIFQDYVAGPLQTSREDEVCNHLLNSLTLLTKRLGSAKIKSIEEMILNAFKNAPHQASSHAPWIEQLLVEHYDPLYERGFKRHTRKILYEGTIDSCRKFLNHEHQSKK